MLGFRRVCTQQIIHDDYHTVNRRRKNRRIVLLIITGLVTIALAVGWQQSRAETHPSSYSAQ